MRHRQLFELHIHDLDSKVSQLLLPGEHSIQLHLTGAQKPSYDGYADPPDWDSDNSIIVKSLPKVSRYTKWDDHLIEQPCVMRVHNDGEWKFAQCNGVLSPLSDENGEAIYNSDNERLYTLEKQ